MTHTRPPGAVIVPCQETARYNRFTISLTNLNMPEGSHTIFALGTSIVRNLNDAIRQLRPQDEWVWIVGDDHVFPPDTLERLLDTGFDMVAPLCVRRGPPFPLVHYGDRTSEHGPFRHVLQFDQIPGTPFEVQATGSLPLIRRQVLDAVGDPWFANGPEYLDEEFGFCDRVRAAGWRIWVVPDVAVGHIGELVAWPAKRYGEWGLSIEYSGADTAREFYPGGMTGKIPVGAFACNIDESGGLA